MGRNHSALRRNILIRVMWMTLLACIGVIQAVGTILVAIGVVVLKPIAILMIAAAGVLAMFAQFPWPDVISVFIVSAVLFWLPETGALLLVALTVLQGKIAAENNFTTVPMLPEEL